MAEKPTTPINTGGNTTRGAMDNSIKRPTPPPPPRPTPPPQKKK